MKGRLIIAALAAFAAACTHQQVVKTTTPPAPASQNVWDRQVRNAVDAMDDTIRDIRGTIFALQSRARISAPRSPFVVRWRHWARTTSPSNWPS